MIRLKNPAQIEKIRKSAQVMLHAFRRTRERLLEGVSTLELDRIAREAILERGAKPAFLGYLDYPATLCVSPNDTVIHGIPDATRLRKGDLVSLDLGVDLDGFFSDSAYSFVIGDAAPATRRLLDVTKECLFRGISAAKPGNRVSDISRAVYAHATANGYGVVTQFCGHGVGFSPHEDPQVPNYVSSGSNPRLKPGMVIAIEPMINMGSGDVHILDDGWTVKTVDGSLSAHFEHTVAVLSDGAEILTSFDFDG